VPDAAAPPPGALALLVRRTMTSPGPGELDIPAIRGVGGSMIRLLDRGQRPVADVGGGFPHRRPPRQARA
jgi:4-hydroxyphenylpyruvate dioxygenase-like putative hemolysin